MIKIIALGILCYWLGFLRGRYYTLNQVAKLMGFTRWFND
jgi:hypothetical protein